MQLLLWCTSIYLLGIFYVAHIIYRKGVVSWNQGCSLSLSIPGMKHETFCVVRRGERQIQILDGY
jgi:hypothetical protein